MKTAYELFGVEVEDGWKQLYQPIIDYIEEYNKSTNNPIEINQIKEKFGGIRIYLSYYTPELDKMIDEAEEKSFSICECCGKHIDNQIIKNYWIYPLCEDCYENRF